MGSLLCHGDMGVLLGHRNDHPLSYVDVRFSLSYGDMRLALSHMDMGFPLDYGEMGLCHGDLGFLLSHRD